MRASDFLGGEEPQRHDFNDKLSESHKFTDRWTRFYNHVWPGSECHWIDTDSFYQSSGVDCLLLRDGRAKLIEEKLRWTDYGDFLAEVWSDFDRRTAGWTVDTSKKTEILAYAIVPSSICVLLEFKPLREYVINKISGWEDDDPRFLFSHSKKGSRRWRTQNVSLSWREIQSMTIYRGEW